ncbi:plexin domain-containing protein 2 isoform X2 [Sitodiplosis mosellana]|uniref:plexin domain-containing protein 2 isoform X2 n=1 Tax=Sitodiplosis mosellana TaxID=263140 RepID=UPI002444171D|nr:plexin domain-containing protein 2 isoform X2 [Sitodiplosis mosellana]
MANVYCVFIKFCVFCLIFVEFTQSNEINRDQRYQYSIENSDSQKHLANVEFRSFRVKRDTDSPALPVTSSSSSAVASLTSTPTSLTTSDKTKTETPTPQSTQQHLLGVDGAGQRKYYPNDTKMASEPASVLTAAAGTASDNKGPMMNKSLGTVQQSSTSTTKAIDTEATDSDDIEKLIGSIDEPEEAINKTITDELTNSTKKVDYFQYYNSTMVVNKNKSDEYWSAKKDYIISSILSKSHRRAITVQLKFDFPFYGHMVRNVTVATGGFLYTGEYVHSWLAATQYIAPLMANFDTSMSNVSTVKYSDNGTAFTVIWEKVPLQDGTPSKSPLFTFSVTLHNTGDITFAYKEIPIAIENIKDEKHPVKIGLSDAYIIDKTIYFARRKTIYEYHRVNFNGQDIANDTVIYLKALPTCLEHTDCVSCLDAKLETFNCTWCPSLNRCSTGTDRKRQQWIQSGCERSQLKDSKICPALGTKGNNYSSQQTVTSSPSSSATNRENEQQNLSNAATSAATDANENRTSTDVKKAAPHISSSNNNEPKHNHASFALGILLPIIVVASLVMWVFYAYRNPHTKSGQLLIQYRPSQWSWRRGEARYTAATIHM